MSETVSEHLMSTFRRAHRQGYRYWRSLPLSGLAAVLLAMGLTNASIAFTLDVTNALQGPFWFVLATAALLGACTVVLGFTAMRRPKSLLLVFVVMLLLSFGIRTVMPGFASNQPLKGPGFGAIRSRLTADGSLSIFLMLGGLLIFLNFAVTQGVKHIRTRTELELAEKLQQTLAPPLAAKYDGYEIQGRSAPSSQMGGDLLDAVDGGNAMACYVADVAGHGIQAGVFMGMVKSSARTALLRPRPLRGFLADLNRVLFEIKAASATYVTFACLRCGEGGGVEYSLAGNGPILHYHAQSKTTSQLGMEQFPLGMFANTTFQSSFVQVEPGDILTLLTDGMPEVEDAKGEQFGLERIGEIVARNAAGPLADLTDRLFDAVREHGPRTDDETLVLVRANRTGKG
jgi:hypothetical protein